MMPNEDRDFEDEAPTLTDGRTARARILIVEDDRNLRELIVARMRREAFDVIEADSGDEALDILVELAFDTAASAVDLLVVDQRMPGMSGLELAHVLRSAEWSIPVLLITGFPEPRLLAAAARLDIAVLAKPFPLDRLSETAITAMLASRG